MKTPFIFYFLVLPLVSSTLKRNRKSDIFQKGKENKNDYSLRKKSIEVGDIYDEIGDVPGLTASKAYSGGNPDVMTSDTVSHIKRVTHKYTPGLMGSKVDGGGEPFSDYDVLESLINKGRQVSIKKIAVRADSMIDQIAFVLETGDKLVHGGTGGNETSLVLDSSTESLIKVEYQFAPFALLAWIKFTTSKGRTVEGGTMKKKDEIKSIEAPKGSKIVGMHGRNGEFIDSLGFCILAPPPTGKPTSPPNPLIGTNLALNGKATQSSTDGDAAAWAAIDNNTNGGYYGRSVAVTGKEKNPWWKLDLRGYAIINKIIVWNRTDCCMERLSNAEVKIYKGSVLVAEKSIGNAKGIPKFEFGFDKVVGNVVEVKGSQPYLQLAEVQVFGVKYRNY